LQLNQQYKSLTFCVDHPYLHMYITDFLLYFFKCQKYGPFIYSIFSLNGLKGFLLYPWKLHQTRFDTSDNVCLDLQNWQYSIHPTNMQDIKF